MTDRQTDRKADMKIDRQWSGKNVIYQNRLYLFHLYPDYKNGNQYSSIKITSRGAMTEMFDLIHG